MAGAHDVESQPSLSRPLDEKKGPERPAVNNRNRSGQQVGSRVGADRRYCIFRWKVSK